MQLGKNLEDTLRRALAYANERKHKYATLEHLLIALLDDPDAKDALLACDADIHRLHDQLTNFLKDLTVQKDEDEVDPQPTDSFQRVIQ